MNLLVPAGMKGSGPPCSSVDGSVEGGSGCELLLWEERLLLDKLAVVDVELALGLLTETLPEFEDPLACLAKAMAAA